MILGLALRLRARVFLAIVIAMLVCLAATPPIARLSRRIGAMDVPGESRRVHSSAIPRLGGLAIFIAFLAGTLPFTALTMPVQGILLGSVIIVVCGAVDDLISLKPWAKLIFQFLAAYVAIEHGVEIKLLTNPGMFRAEAIALGALSIPVTMLWIVGVTNALNLIDGLDGLAAGVSGIGCASMLAVSLFLPEATEVSVLLAALGGACLGFLPYNRNPARIFMGDTGALLLGFVLATSSILGLFKMYTAATFAVPILALGLPVSDTLFAIVRRVSHGKSPLVADRDHIHHRLLRLGLTQRQAVLVLYAVSTILGLAAVILAANGQTRFWLLMIAIAIAIGVWLYIFLENHDHRTESSSGDATKKDTPPEQ